MNDLDCIEIETGESITYAIIWLHGLGADGNDFAPIVPELAVPAPTRFVFPNAPSIPVTINGGYVMPAWYDITDMSIDRKIDEAQLMASAAQVERLIEREKERGIPYENIVLAGFSQGGAVVYQTALAFPFKLGGLMVLSSYFATRETIQYHPANQGINIFIGHGTQDPIVLEALGKQAQGALSKAGYQSEYHTYPMEHTVCMEEVADISRWLQNILPNRHTGRSRD